MLKARRKDPTEQLKFPEPREGLPEDPRPFMGAEHFAAATAIQELLSAHCLVAVTGRTGSGKSTVGRRAANSRWARQWYLHDENGQPVHRRFWVDLEDCAPGAESEHRVARAVGRPTFAEALARIGNGKPCLLFLDNADQAFVDGADETLEQLVACVDSGASVIVTRRTVSGLQINRPWTDVIEVTGFATEEEAQQLFELRAPAHTADFRVSQIVAACDRLPLAVDLLATAAARADLEVARLRVGPGIDSRGGLDFAIEVAAAMLDAEARLVWAALSLLPSGLSELDIPDVLSAFGDAREPTLRLFATGVAQRCEAGLRVPVPLRWPRSLAALPDAVVSELWGSYVRRAQTIVGPIPDSVSGFGGGTGTASSTTRASAPPATSPDRGEANGRRGGNSRGGRVDAEAVDAWLTRQTATLSRLASWPSPPDPTFDVACAGLLGHRSGSAPDLLDQMLIRLIEAGLASAAGAASGGASSGGAGETPRAVQAAQIAAALEDQRRFGTAVIVAAAVVEAHRRAADLPAEAAALCQLGRAERFCTSYHAAEAHLAEARREFEQLDDGVGQGCALFELGQVDLDLGRLELAEKDLSEALVLFEAHGRPIGAANASLDLVRVDLARGRLDRAEQRLGDAMDRYEAAGDKLGFANACLQLGQVELARAELDGAERRFAGALDGYEQVGDKLGFANACLQLGQVELARGRLISAERRFSGALAGYQRVGDKVGLANASLQLGQIELARGALAPARSRLLHAWTAYEELGDRIGVAHASLQLGQVALGRGELEEAAIRLRAAQTAYDEIGDAMGSANSRHVWAQLLEAQRFNTHAMFTYGEAARLYSAMGRTASAGWSMAGAARTSSGKAERKGYAADAVRLLEKAGLADAAAQLERELAERERRLAPAVVVPPEAEPEVSEEPLTSAWPAILEVVVDPVPDAVVDPVADAVVEVVDPVPDAVVDPVADAVVDPVADAVVDPVPEVVDPVADAVVDPVADAVVDPVPEVVDPVADAVVDPVAEVLGDPVTERRPADAEAGVPDDGLAEAPSPELVAPNSDSWAPAWAPTPVPQDAPAPRAGRASATGEQPEPVAACTKAPTGDSTGEWLPPWSPGVQRAILAAPGDWESSWSPSPEEAASPHPYVPASPKPRSVWASIQTEDGDVAGTPLVAAIPTWTADDPEPWSTGPHTALSEPLRGPDDEPPEDIPAPPAPDESEHTDAGPKPHFLWRRRKDR